MGNETEHTLLARKRWDELRMEVEVSTRTKINYNINIEIMLTSEEHSNAMEGFMTTVIRGG